MPRLRVGLVWNADISRWLRTEALIKRMSMSGNWEVAYVRKWLVAKEFGRSLVARDGEKSGNNLSAKLEWRFPSERGLGGPVFGQWRPSLATQVLTARGAYVRACGKWARGP